MSDTAFTYEPTCPICGYVERDAWEIDFGGIEGDTTHTCNSCGEDYALSRIAMLHYRSATIAKTNRSKS